MNHEFEKLINLHDVMMKRFKKRWNDIKAKESMKNFFDAVEVHLIDNYPAFEGGEDLDDRNIRPRKSTSNV